MAISSPLLEVSIDGAHGVLLSIQGGSDLGLFEINEAAELVANSAAVDANIIFGAVIDDALGDEVRVTVIAAGFDEHPSRPASATTFSLSDGRPTAAPGNGSAGGNGAGAGPAAGNGASGGSSATWGGTGTSPTGHSQAGTATPGHAPATAAAVPAQAPAHAPSVPAPSVSASPVSVAPVSGNAGSGTGKAPGSGNGAAGHGAAGAHHDSEVPAQPAGEAAAGYVPAPVSFVSPDEDEDYGSYDSGRTDAAAGGSAPGSAQSWKDSGRAKQDKVFDVTAGRRRPVVFEEEDDLDVPDFLK